MHRIGFAFCFQLAALSTWWAMSGCISPVETKETALIEGQVVARTDQAPLSGAMVQALPYAASALTNEAGRFSLEFELPDSTSATVTMIVSKTGFVSDTIPSVIIQNGRNTTLAPIALATTATTRDSLPASGSAASIVLVDLETPHIFVIGPGAIANTALTFEIRDSTGMPVDLAHHALVHFKITGGPEGREYVYPDSSFTNESGRVVATVNSGTKAGALQIVAEIVAAGISSAPVVVAIHGGLPDLDHFAMAPEKLNFPGYDRYGVLNRITAFVGDSYSNPVAPGTVVRFHSTGGIVEGSAVTDGLGRASVSLLSASPSPRGVPGLPFPYSEPGFALITAQTVDENRAAITTTAVVLFSGRTHLEISPRTFTLEPDSSQAFAYTVKDENDNPLVAGTTVSVSTTNGELAGRTNVSLEDTQSRTFTQFIFILRNTNPDSIAVKDAIVTVQINSENGNTSSMVTGQMLPRN